MAKTKITYRFLLHLFFWFLAFVFLSLFFGHFNRDIKDTSIFVLLQMPIIIATTYVINYYLIPRFYFRKKIGLFIYLLLGMIIISLWLNALITTFILIVIYQLDVELLPPESFDFLFLSAGLYLVIAFGVAIHFVKHSFKQQKEKFTIQEKQLETELMLKESRLKLLKRQLHPHLLFNSLNTIYGLSLDKSDKTSELIVSLSNLLDYMLYQCEDERIPLEKEIEFINNYTEIEQHKLINQVEVNMKWPSLSEEYLIAPLILLPFCENCFKYTKSTNNDRAFISIICGIENHKLHFKAKNTFEDTEIKKKADGIGLKNVRERLNLSYPEKHSLKIENENGVFTIELILELDILAS